MLSKTALFLGPIELEAVVRSTGFSRKTCKFRLKAGLQTCEISFEMGSNQTSNIELINGLC